ncbi:hypothetical protein GGR52DRAFT_74086 [Hypoxylon sp. FL1284]|nr:hypothetical protein GGR52DRAFT_74086 [Hypoxylon sp. FL1284]
MARPGCFSSASPARALHRVLVSDLAGRSSSSSTTPSSPSYSLFPPRLFSSSTRVLAQTMPTRPSLAATTTTTSSPTTRIEAAAGARAGGVRAGLGVRAMATKSPQQRKPSASAREGAFQGRPTGHKIPYRWVRIASRSGFLSQARRLEAVLASLDPTQYTLVMVAPPPEPAPSDDSSSEPASSADFPDPPAAICRVVNTAEAVDAAAEAARARRRKLVETKEVELTWTIAGHDLNHKLRRVREFLLRGRTVEVMVARKRPSRPHDEAQAKSILSAIHDTVAAVDGAREVRAMDGDLRYQARLFFEGPPYVPKAKKKLQRKAEKEAEAEAEAEG